MTFRTPFYVFVFATVSLFGSVPQASAQEIVLYASQAHKVGNWSSVSDSTAAGGARLTNPDAGAAKITTPAANPSSYAELTFSVSSGIPYRLWIRGKAQNNSPYNDSVFVQFSGSVNSVGSAVYRIGTTSASDVNLEDCFGCGVQGWGWQDNGWGVGILGPAIFFQTSGTQTIRIQPREDGFSIDQIVLSPSTYLYSSPGALKNDNKILTASSGTSTAPSPTPTPTPTTLTESPNNTRVPPATQIVDSTGAIWTLSTNGAILRNGAGTDGAGSQILYCNRIVYVFGTDLNWWRWTGSGWTQVGTVDPCGGSTPTPTPTPTPSPAQSSSDIVIWASNIPASGIRGNWLKESNSAAAGQVLLRNPDGSAAKLTSPLANPTDYFEVSFNAEAGKPYRIWIRGRADNNFWGNDSVYAQFSGSLNTLGATAYRIGTTSAADINLEDCSGCGLSGWGWQDNGWGVGVLGPAIFFQNTGAQTLRIQRREDGLAIDQIVISSYAYLYSSPGLLKNDATILQSTLGTTPTNQAPTVNISATPTSGNSPLFVSFSSTATDPDGHVASYYWTFGDGKTSTAPNPTNTYQSAGTYTAKLAVTDNAGATNTATIQINVSSSQSTSQLRVLSWNMSFGTGTDGVNNYDRTATWIANINADLVALSEMPPDKISTLVNLVSQKTGRTWYSHFVAKYPNCQEGNLIMSKYSFTSTGGRYLSYERSVAQATLAIGGKTVNFFATHLDPSSSSVRYTQVGELMSFASNYAESRIVAGDFNAGPDTSEVIRMTGGYHDTWMQAMNIGTAIGYPDNPVGLHTRTRRGRIDYVFYSKGSNTNTKNAQVPDSRDLNNRNVVLKLGTADDYGVRPSDHNHMIANIELR